MKRLLLTLIALVALHSPVAFAATKEPPPPPTLSELRNHPLVGRIWLAPTHRFVSPEQLVRLAASADFVLLGETHDNPDHHALQAWMVRRLAAAGHPPRRLAMEMLEAGQQPALEQFARDHPGSADGLDEAVDWARTGWPSWDWYRPIVQAALDAHATLATANLSAASLRAIATGAEAPPPGADIAALSPEQAQAMKDDIADGHCGLMPENKLPAMMRVQMARDATMARALSAARPTVLIAGSGHARNDRAVPWHLARAGIKGRTLTIAFVEVEDGQTHPAAYAKAFGATTLPFDAVWFTARAERDDPCEGLRRHLSGGTAPAPSAAKP